ncbi:Tol-Pal system beta propeller repeat protein TolB [Blochmannia endosymbiont of Colobopsis nipponica]|uniref:Tol-Pal system beta propeller repeat protein TolB n=1 Tax=Blochmannia endosymbiont of Colobopsis nipponica TaxID=2681987 RepID=UPI0017836815|nr:Tol-Pal system beta propeller repeat protein TolB [Blochmannia endosymbiont of Colobopsis nipponica]QOI11106.1 Tol-Pal system beta propeller repeat protein TolB [Blochmannia endosymbiont of Colobopsis nipponica]
MQFRLVSLVVLFLLIYNVNFGYAQVYIEITQGVNSAYPIGIVPFEWKGIDEQPEDISKIISNDFCNTGKFQVLSESLLPQKPFNTSEVQPALWVSLDINAIIIGQLEKKGNDSYDIAYQLIDIAGQTSTVLLRNKYNVNKEWLRHVAHVISNEVFKKLTGIQGSFCTRIAYVARINKKNQCLYELWVADYDGYNPVVINRSLEPLMSPAWSADGDNLAYVTFVNKHAVLVIHTLSNGIIRQIVNFSQHNGAPAFSPDGKKLAFASSNTGSLNIYIIDLISKNIHQITNSRNNSTEPSWFPDGQNLVYTSDQGGNPQIYKINANGGNSQRLSWSGISNQNAIVSMDGKFLILINKNNDNMQHVARLNLTTGVTQILTNTLLDETPSISPNGFMIIYSAMQNGEIYSLQLVSIDGIFKAYLPTINKNEDVRFPAWSPFL